MAEVIKVTFPDGEEICYRSPVNTVLEVLRRIEPARFPEIDLKTAQQRLITTEVAPKLKKYSKKIGNGWYYINRSDTREKTSQLININRILDLNLKIEVGNFETVRNPLAEGITRSKKRIIVTMPNGDIIDYESPKDVFITVIDRLGPRKISSQANIELNGTQSLLTVTNPEGNRVKIHDTLYLAYPRTTQEMATILNIISHRLGLSNSMKIEIISLKEHK